MKENKQVVSQKDFIETILAVFMSLFLILNMVIPCNILLHPCKTLVELIEVEKPVVHIHIGIVICIIIIFILGVIILKPKSDEAFMCLLFIGFVYFMGVILSVTAISNMNTDIVKKGFNSNNIVDVYADSGESKYALIEFKMNNGEKEVKERMYADKLGYDAVISKEDIKKPKKILTPTGVTLEIPESMVKEKLKGYGATTGGLEIID